LSPWPKYRRIKSETAIAACGTRPFQRIGIALPVRTAMVSCPQLEERSMRAEMTQEEFESQWKPIPGEDFSLPACHEGMILLKAFADAHPDSFQFIRPEERIAFLSGSIPREEGNPKLEFLVGGGIPFAFAGLRGG
jgi:hypothetical protein